MRISPVLPVWPWLAPAGVLLLCLSPCAAAQAQKPALAPFESPAKPQKPAATVAQPPAEQPPTAGPKGAPSPDAIPEDEDFLKGREEWFLGDRTLPDGSVATGMRQRALKHVRSEEHTSELQSLAYLVCRLLLEKKKYRTTTDRDLH